MQVVWTSIALFAFYYLDLTLFRRGKKQFQHHIPPKYVAKHGFHITKVQNANHSINKTKFSENPNIPLEHTPGIPKPPNERNSFINRWLGSGVCSRGMLGFSEKSTLELSKVEGFRVWSTQMKSSPPPYLRDFCWLKETQILVMNHRYPARKPVMAWKIYLYLEGLRYLSGGF